MRFGLQLLTRSTVVLLHQLVEILLNLLLCSNLLGYSRTAFAPATKKVSEKNATVVTKKVATKEEIKKNLDKMMQKYNRTAALK